MHIPSPLTWPSSKRSGGTETSALTGSVDGCSVLPETEFVGTRLHKDKTQVLSVGTAEDRPGFDIRLSGLHSRFFLDVISCTLPQECRGLK